MGRNRSKLEPATRTWKVTYEARESSKTPTRKTFTAFEDATSGDAAATKAFGDALSKGQLQVQILAVEVSSRFERSGGLPV